MCAIAGLVSKNGAPPSQAVVRGMMAGLAHRGPDAEGVWEKDGACLGHRRLSIIDLSEGGRQPMVSDDGELAVTYNGEIYNYIELRKELEKTGAKFRSESDTEVLLQAYAVWGSACVKKFRGMFAFAVHDRKNGTVFLARDRMGKKPLFYRTLKNGTVAFASELKALVPLEPTSPDLTAIRLFMGLQYVPSPRTGYEGILSLPPGSTAQIMSGDVKVSTYHSWQLPAEPARLSPQETDETIARLLEEAVVLRLRSDVPVASFLSGGIDSTAITALAMKHLARPMKTFTMGFPSIAMDERNEAAAVARALGTEHHAFEATPQDLLVMAETIVRQYDAPYADSSALPLMLISAQAAKEAKVVLAGDGGDELFGGYKRYAAYGRALKIARIPGAAAALRAAGQIRRDTRLTRMADALSAGAISENRIYGELFCGSYVSSTLAQELCTPELLAQKHSDPVSFVDTQMGTVGNPVLRAMRFDLASYLADDLNVKMDRATMAHGLEARCPLLDTELAAFALTLPLHEKIDGGKTKVALRRALQQVLPKNVAATGVLERPKRGFQVPLAEWFRGPLAQPWKDRCLDPQGPLTRFVRTDAAARLFAEHKAGYDHGNRLWMLYALALWAEKA